MYTKKELCEKYNINYARLSYWINKSGYKPKPKPKAKEKEPQKASKRLSSEIVRQIREDAKTMRICAIARKYGIAYNIVRSIITGRTYRTI
jgi:ribosomal protein S25